MEGDDAVRAREEARRVASLLRERDVAFLQAMKLVVRDGVLVFEELETETMRAGGARLISCLRRVPEVARTFLRSLSGDLYAGGRLPEQGAD